MPSAEFVTKWNPNQGPVSGYWGEVTSTLDWCERNYDISRYVAEWWNTISNIFFVALAAYGMYQARKEVLPLRHLVAMAGIALIGIGSFAFHGTLKYEYQLLDEIPMVTCASTVVWILFDIGHTPSKRSVLLPAGIFVYNIFVIVVYAIWPEPVFHQVAYALVQSTTTFRTAYLLYTRLNETSLERKVKKEIYQLERLGSAIFMLGFFVWNIENQFCGAIDNYRLTLHPYLRPFLELHAWWHICTGYGAYLMVVGIQRFTLAISDREGSVAGCAKYEIMWRVDGLVPYVARTELGWRSFVGKPVKEDAETLAKKA